MIFQTQNQIYCIFIFLFFGFISALIYYFTNLIFLIKFQKNLIKNIFFAIFYCFFSVFFIILINFFNFGNFNLTLLATYIIGFIWIKTLLSKTLVIFENKWYNKIIRIKNNKLRKQKENELTKKN